MTLFDLFDDGVILALFVFEDQVLVIHTDDGLVGGDLHYVQLVDLTELGFLGEGGAGHAGELRVDAEQVLMVARVLDSRATSTPSFASMA